MENNQIYCYCIRTKSGYLDAIEYDIYDQDEDLAFLLCSEKLEEAKIFKTEKELGTYIRYHKKGFRQFFPDGIRVVALIPETKTPVYGYTIHWPKGDK